MATSLENVKFCLKTHFKIQDWEAVEIIFACAASLYCLGEMLWIRFVGASRSGKTELLRAIETHQDSESVEILTPSAIRGGLKAQHQKLLNRLNGKRVVTLDLSAILTTRKDARNEIFGLLRCVKDGKIASDFGSDEGHLLQSSKFDWLMGTTSAFEQSRVMESLLGERFLDLWWIPADREAMAIQAAENNTKLVSIRKELATLVSTMFDEAKRQSNNLVTTPDNVWFGKVGNIAALLRSPILKDRTGNITAMPQPEVGTDLAQSFQKVSAGLQLLGITDYRPYIKRLAKDCMSSIRQALIVELFYLTDPVKVSDMSTRLMLPESTLRYHLVDLEALRIVEKTTDSYRLKDKERHNIALLF